jgi:hypothetical protein
MLLLLTASVISTLSPATIRAQAAQLRERGFTVMQTPLVPASLIDTARDDVSVALSGLHRKVEAAGFHPIDQQYLFREVCYRQFCRWDVRKPSDGVAAWGELLNSALATAVMPIVRELQVEHYTGIETSTSGAIVSWPGAPGQCPHADAKLEHYGHAAADLSFRSFNCFVPLVDIPAGIAGDGTQFWPGSHDSAEKAMMAWERATADGWEEILENPSKGHLSEAVAPACPAGALIMFDVRLIHGGLPSRGRVRPVAYSIVSTGGATDDNFPSTSIWTRGLRKGAPFRIGMRWILCNE